MRIVAITVLLSSYIAMRRTQRNNGGSTCSAQGGACANVDVIVSKARRVIEAVPYQDRNSPGGPHPVTLITQDADGYASARAVVPRQIGDDLSFFRLNTREGTRKLAELRNNPKTTLSFHDQRGRQGWLTIKGDSVLEAAADGSVDILFYAKKLEAVSYNEQLMADSEGWKPILLHRDNGSWLLQQ
jgi:hypothetical protein